MAKAKFIKYLGVFLIGHTVVYASFIEQTLGTAVINDATATYFNPAALTLLSEKQIITLATGASSQFQFNGNAQRKPFGLVESGVSATRSNFFLPSVYLGIPSGRTFYGGFAVVLNDFNRELENYSILRYVQAPNHIYDIDLVPALGIKINEFLSIGGNLNFSSAHFLQEPLSGIRSLTIPESRSTNNSKGKSLGWTTGILIKKNKGTAFGLYYRSALRYHLQGTSVLDSPFPISSDNYHFRYWTPARSVFSLSHFLNKQWGLIGTAQYLQWDIFKHSGVYNFATQVGSKSVIVPKATIHYNFHNSWVLTLGTLYKLSPKITARVAGTYSQSPASGQFQVEKGDSFAVGSSLGCRIMNNLLLDLSYAHAFFAKKAINVHTPQNDIHGVNKGDHDSLSAKLTINL